GPAGLAVRAKHRPGGVPPPAPIELVTVDDTRHDTHDDTHHEARPAADVSLAAPPVRAFTVVPVVPAVVQPPGPETEPEHTAAMDLPVDIEPTALPTDAAAAPGVAADLAPTGADGSEPEPDVVDAAPGVPQMRADEAPPPLSASSWQAPDSPGREEESPAATDAPAQQEPPIAAVETPSVDTAPAAAATAVDEDIPATAVDEDMPAAVEGTAPPRGGHPPAPGGEGTTPAPPRRPGHPPPQGGKGAPPLPPPARPDPATPAVDGGAAPAPAPAEPPPPPLFVAAAPPVP